MESNNNEKTLATNDSPRPPPVNLSELAQFCRRMGVGLRAGVDVFRLLGSEKKSGGVRHRKVMEDVEMRIRSGETFAEAMKAHPKHFPNLLVQMVHASELGGRLDSTFLSMAGYYEQLKLTRSSFLQKITWPLVQLAMAVGVIGLVILIQAALSPNAQYDATALGLKGYRGFAIYCTVVACLVAAFGVLIWGISKNGFNCHAWIVPLVGRIPKLGTAITTLSLSRLSMTLSMLLNAGVDAREAVKQAFLSTGNHYLIGGMQKAVDAVSRGESFGDAFEESEVLPREFVDDVRVGELSGTETESLDRMAEQYQQKAASALSTLATIASFSVWMGIVILIGFMILRMAMQYINLLYDTIENPMG